MVEKYTLDYCLKVLLADTVAMKFTAHGFHWNVEGPDFAQYHEFFETIYVDVDSYIDPLAENIRKLDCYVPFSFQTFSDLHNVYTFFCLLLLNPIRSTPIYWSEASDGFKGKRCRRSVLQILFETHITRNIRINAVFS